jgi:hypothetical protein
VRRAFIDVDSNAAWQAVLADWYDGESAAA